MSSKYDVVKLKVHVGRSQFYILSRFLLSKMLTFCKVPTTEATRISLDVKRHFVNSNRVSITQEELEDAVKAQMILYGFAGAHTSLLPVMTLFYMERVPLIILVCGGYGKTSLAQCLGSKLNNTNVINTEMLLSITNAVESVLLLNSPCADEDAASQPGPAQEAASYVQHWQDQCQRVWPAVRAGVQKALKKGGVVVVEGAFINLSLVHVLMTTLALEFRSMVMPFILCAPPADDASVEQRAAFFGKEVTDYDRFVGAVNARQFALLECSGVNPLVHLRIDVDSEPALEDVGVGGGGDAIPAVVYSVALPHPSYIQRVGDALHDRVVERILSELRRRGVLLDTDAAATA